MSLIIMDVIQRYAAEQINIINQFTPIHIFEQQMTLAARHLSKLRPNHLKRAFQSRN